LAAVLGIGLAVVSDSPTVAYARVVLVGLGMATVIPTVFATAGRQPGISLSGAAIATVAAASWPAFLVGPPLVGAVAEASSLRIGLSVVAVAALTISLLARWVRFPADVAPTKSRAGSGPVPDRDRDLNRNLNRNPTETGPRPKPRPEPGPGPGRMYDCR
jgi:hypothetical protein